MRVKDLAVLAAAAALAAACDGGTVTGPNSTGPGGGDSDEVQSFEDFISGKADTGYVGNRAAELEATFEAKVRVQLPGKTPEELQAIADDLKANRNSWSHSDVTKFVTEQTKYARNALKANKLDLNLEGSSPLFREVGVLPEALELTYSVTVESLVKFKELEAQGLTPADLVGRVIEPKLPLVPEGLFAKAGATCATDVDTGNAPPVADLGDHNFFYYFDPLREGCVLGQQDIVVGRYEIQSSLDTPTVYPEYDKLVADGRIDMVALFGQITHGELKSSDWGFIAYSDFARALTSKGFRKVETFPDNRGQRLEKTYPGGLQVMVDMLTPVNFADAVPRDESSAKFQEAMRGNEVVYYNGHAFYGSLTVLDSREAYPADTYQIIFMDACWSYAYYTKQVFRNKATEADPEGYALADVVNNTEPGITGSELTAAILYDAIFKGASAVHAGGDASIYSWNKMTEYMNASAEERARYRSSHPNPEIYGVSGVRTNAWRPGGAPPVEPPPATGSRFASDALVEIPDNDAAGATSTITVPAGAGTVAVVKVEVDIQHTYVGDLTVTVEHAGRTLVLHEQQGGGDDDLALRLSTDTFAGLAAEGAWTLKVVDGAGEDAGAIKHWAIEL